MTPVRLEPAALRSRVKLSTTEPLRSLLVAVVEVVVVVVLHEVVVVVELLLLCCCCILTVDLHLVACLCLSWYHAVVAVVIIKQVAYFGCSYDYIIRFLFTVVSWLPVP